MASVVSSCSTAITAMSMSMSMSMASLQARDLLALLLATVATLLFLRHLLASAKRRVTSPSLPRPRGLPLIGNLHQIGTLPHQSLAALAAKHAAPLMMLRLGSVKTLVISTADAARALFEHNDRALSDRPAHYATSRLSYGLQSITFAPADSEFWRGARRACLSELLGAPRVRGFCNVREREAAMLVAAVADVSGTDSPVNLSHMLLASSSKILRRVAFGEDSKDSMEARVVPVLRETQSLLGAFWVADYVPWLGWLDALRGLRRRLERNFHELDAFYERVIEAHLHKRKSSEEEDLVDVLLRLHTDPAQRSTFGTRSQIKGILTDMFIAGSDTSATAVEWTMTELVNHPDVLAKAQHEVRSVVGNKDMVKESDLPCLTYLNLVIKEAMRLHPPVPLLLPRETTEACTVQGCKIPAKTLVLINAMAIDADPKAWGPDVALFVPERHEQRIDDGAAADVSEFKPWHDNFNLLPFGIRRRSCPGVRFATAVVELVLANLLLSFDWRAPLGMVDVEEVTRLAVHRKNPLVLVAKRRCVQ